MTSYEFVWQSFAPFYSLSGIPITQKFKLFVLQGYFDLSGRLNYFCLSILTFTNLSFVVSNQLASTSEIFHFKYSIFQFDYFYMPSLYLLINTFLYCVLFISTFSFTALSVLIVNSNMHVILQYVPFKHILIYITFLFPHMTSNFFIICYILLVIITGRTNHCLP